MAELGKKHGLEANTNGVGIRRDIPWPEIFKHHISAIEGHLKMMEMVKKHTVEGSGNWRMICELLDRTNEMLQVSKQQARTFLATPGQREQVPLGSSSAADSHTYSATRHKHRDTAEESGRAAVEARAVAAERQHPLVEDEFRQAKGIKRRTLAGIREALATKGQVGGNSPVPGSERPITSSPKGKAASSENANDPIQEGENPFFINDTKPSPIRFPIVLSQPVKRSLSPSVSLDSKTQKKAKRSHDREYPNRKKTLIVEFEDISGEVDARLKEKEEKRKRKEEKKRKRESEGDQAEDAEIAGTNAEASAIDVGERKPKRKKARGPTDEELVDRTLPKKRPGEASGGNGHGEGKQKRKRKKDNGAMGET